MDLRLDGKTAYLTGGAQGIGAAIVSLLVGEGVRVAVSDRDAPGLAATAQGWTGGPAPVLLGGHDLATAQGVAEACALAVDALDGPPDIVVNNVGAGSEKVFVDVSDEEWLQCFNINLMSHVRTCRVLLPLMAAQGGGTVVNVSSDLAKQPEPIPMDYGCMKSALLYLTKALSKEFAPAVRVNAVCPGPVWTPLWSRPGGLVDHLAELYGVDREAALARYLQDRQMPLGISQPADVAVAVAVLVSPLSGSVTGTTADVGGTLRGLF